MVLVLLIIALVLFIIAALPVPTPPWINLGWLGLAFFAAASVVTAVH